MYEPKPGNSVPVHPLTRTEIVSAEGEWSVQSLQSNILLQSIPENVE